MASDPGDLPKELYLKLKKELDYVWTLVVAKKHIIDRRTNATTTAEDFYSTMYKIRDKGLHNLQKYLAKQSQNPNIGRFISGQDIVAKFEEAIMLIDADIEQFQNHFEEDEQRMREIDLTLSALKSAHPKTLEELIGQFNNIEQSVPNPTKFTISHRLFPMRFHKSRFANIPSAMFGYLFRFGKTLVTLDIVSPVRVARLNRDRGATTTPLTFEESLFFSDYQILNVEVARLMGDVAEDVQDSSIEGFEKRATNEQHALLVELYKLWNPNKKLPPNADPLWILVCCLECRAWLPKCAFDKAKIKRFHKSGWAPTCNMCLMMNEMHRSPLEFFDHSSTYEDACRQMIHVWDHPPINQVAVGNWDTMAKSSARVASEPVPPVSLESTTAEVASAPSLQLVASRDIQPPPACALTDEEIEEFKKDLIDEHRGICPVSMSVIYDCTDKRCNLQRVCRKFNNERNPKCDRPACRWAHIHMTCPAESSGFECLRLKALPEQQPHVLGKAHKGSISLTEYASRVALAKLIPAHRCRRYGCSQ